MMKSFKVKLKPNKKQTTPKPERLLQRILTLATNEGDIVLDNFLGSGTTAAVAHKMGRQYIGVEQMDYIETVTVARLKKVIAGEAGGISRAVNCQGGGSFIYCKLAKQNQNFVEEIQAAQDCPALSATKLSRKKLTRRRKNLPC